MLEGTVVPHRSGPARPGIGTTPEGRPMQVVTSYARRGSRMSATQRAAWDRHVDEWLIPVSAVDEQPLVPAKWLGREAPMIVEIGSGVGEAVAALAASRPDHDVLAFEVWRPGVAGTFLNLEATGASNVRLMSVDAVWALEHLLVPGQLAELWTFFPDPWHKKRHHKRRLVTPAFAALAASRLAAGGMWRLATDWPHYAEQITAIVGAEPLLYGGPTERWSERPVTKFERRGIAEDRRITDFTYTRR
jgi:tRNA (guanine-N7-)-methyltransferase